MGGGMITMNQIEQGDDDTEYTARLLCRLRGQSEETWRENLSEARRIDNAMDFTKAKRFMSFARSQRAWMKARIEGIKWPD